MNQSNNYQTQNGLNGNGGNAVYEFSPHSNPSFLKPGSITQQFHLQQQQQNPNGGNVAQYNSASNGSFPTMIFDQQNKTSSAVPGMGTLTSFNILGGGQSQQNGPHSSTNNHSQQQTIQFQPGSNHHFVYVPQPSQQPGVNASNSQAPSGYPNMFVQHQQQQHGVENGGHTNSNIQPNAQEQNRDQRNEQSQQGMSSVQGSPNQLQQDSHSGKMPTFQQQSPQQQVMSRSAPQQQSSIFIQNNPMNSPLVQPQQMFQNPNGNSVSTQQQQQPQMQMQQGVAQGQIQPNVFQLQAPISQQYMFPMAPATSLAPQGQQTNSMPMQNSMTGQFVQSPDGTFQFVPMQQVMIPQNQNLIFDPKTGQTYMAYMPPSQKSVPLQVVGYSPGGNFTTTLMARPSSDGADKSYSSKFRGVSWHRRDRKWLARTWINGRIEHLGCFRSEDMAALAVDIRTIEHFGDDCKDLNFPDMKQREALKTKFVENGEFKLRSKEALLNPIPRSNRRSKSKFNGLRTSSSNGAADESSLALKPQQQQQVLAASSQKRKAQEDKNSLSDGPSKRMEIESPASNRPKTSVASLLHKRNQKGGGPPSPTASSGSWSGSGVSVRTDELAN